MATSSSPVPALRADGLSKRFGATEAVADLSLDVAPGEVFGFLGPNVALGSWLPPLPCRRASRLRA